MKLTFRTLFLTAHAHILNLELWGRAIFFCCLLVRNAEPHRVQDQLQTVGALAHSYDESSRSHLSWVLPQEGAQFIECGSHLAQHSTFVGSSKDQLDVVDSDL